MQTSNIIDFLKVAGGLKEIERFRDQMFWKDYEKPARYESVADHTWRMGILLMLTEKYLSQKIDMPRAFKMLLIHDLAEILTGDLSPLGSDGTGRDSHLYDKAKAEEKYRNEEIAAKKIFANLPPDRAQEFYDIWMEYEKQESFESKVVKAMDKLEGKLQAAEYAAGQMVPKHMDFSLKYGMAALEIDPFIKELGEAVNEELRKNGVK